MATNIFIFILKLKKKLLREYGLICLAHYFLWIMVFLLLFPFITQIFGSHPHVLLITCFTLIVILHTIVLQPIKHQISNPEVLLNKLEDLNPNLRGVAWTLWNHAKTRSSSYFIKQIIKNFKSLANNLQIPSIKSFINIKNYYYQLILVVLIGIPLVLIFPDTFKNTYHESLKSIQEINLPLYTATIDVDIKNIQITPPLHTRLEPYVVDDFNDPTFELKVHAGSRLLISVEPTNLLKSEMDKFVIQYQRESKKEMSYGFYLKEDSEGNVLWKTNFLILQPGKIIFAKFDETKLIGKSKQFYPVTLIPDQNPSVNMTILNPKKDYSDRDIVALETNATDDFGLQQLEVVYKINNSSPRRETIRKFSSSQRKTYHEKYKWNLFVIPLQSEDQISFWIEAKDNDRISGPNIGQSHIETITIQGAYDKHLDNLVDLRNLKISLINNLADYLTVKIKVLSPKQIIDNTKDIVKKIDKLNYNLLTNPLGDTFLMRRLNIESSKFKRFYYKLLRQVQRHKDIAFEKDIAFTPGIPIHENLIYLIHDIVQNQEISNIIHRSEDFFAAFQRLEKLLQDYKRNPSEQLKKKIERALQEVKTYLQEMHLAMGNKYREMSIGNINKEAIERLRKNNLTETLDKIGNSLDSLEIEDIEKQLSHLMEEYSKTINDMSSATRQHNQQKYNDLMNQYQMAMKQLNSAQKRQNQIYKQSQHNQSPGQPSGQPSGQFPGQFPSSQEEALYQKLSQKQKKVESTLKAMNKYLSGLDGTLLNTDSLKDGSKSISQEIKKVHQSIDQKSFKQAHYHIERTKNKIDHLQNRFEKLAQEMKQYIKKAGHSKNRNQRQRFGNHIISDHISLEHTYEIDKKYREDIIDSMQESYPESNNVDIDLFYKRIVK